MLCVLLFFVVFLWEVVDIIDVVSKEWVIIRLGFFLIWMWFIGNFRDWNWYFEVYCWCCFIVEFRGVGNGRKLGFVNINFIMCYDVFYYLFLWFGLNLYFVMDFNFSENKIDFYMLI